MRHSQSLSHLLLYAINILFHDNPQIFKTNIPPHQLASGHTNYINSYNNISIVTSTKYYYIQMKPTTTILSTVLLLLVISASNSFTFIQPSVDASPIIVSESSVYTILLTRQYAPSLTPTPWDTQLVPIGSQIIVLFPNEFTLDNLATAQCTDLLFGTN